MGKNIVVGISGGIAAYKAVGVVRLLVKGGHDVHVVPTEAALRFVGLPTWEAISRNPVTASLYDDVAAVRHVALGQAADLIVVAPATANTLAKIAGGFADDLLGTTILASRAPVLVAPAMHTEMWANAATQANVTTLRERGVTLVGPESGALTAQDEGFGRMSEPEAIVAAARDLLNDEHGPGGAAPAATPAPAPAQDLAGLTIVISAGGTREPLDPVRFLGNRSSGKQGVAIARAAVARGAHVTVVAAHLETAVDTGDLHVLPVSTASEMALAVESAAEVADVVVMAAAVADYRPAQVSESKIKKNDHGDDLTLHLVRNPDILAGLAANPTRPEGQVVVGFAAETAPDRDALLALGRSKAARKNADLLVVNAVGWGAGFGSDDNAIVVLAATGDVVAEAQGTKREVADVVLDRVADLRALRS